MPVHQKNVMVVETEVGLRLLIPDTKTVNRQ